MNRLYNTAAYKFVTAALNWDTADIRMALVADTYTYNQFDATGADIGGEFIGSPLVIDNLEALTNGVVTGDDVTFASLTDSRTVGGVILLEWVTDINDAELVAYYDTVAGVPFTPTGGNYTIATDTGFGGYFQIGGESCQ